MALLPPYLLHLVFATPYAARHITEITSWKRHNCIQFTDTKPSSTPLVPWLQSTTIFMGEEAWVKVVNERKMLHQTWRKTPSI